MQTESSPQGNHVRQREKDCDLDVTPRRLQVLQSFLLSIHPLKHLPHDCLTQLFREVGELHVLLHDVILENKGVRKVQRRKKHGLYHDTNLPQGQSIHEQSTSFYYNF